MSDSKARSWVWSVSLVAGGVVLLLFNLGWLDAYAPWPQILLAVGCSIIAAIFFIAFARNRQEWWRLLPAWTLTSLAGMSLSSALAGVDRSLIAAQVFAGLALAFGHIYLLSRQERWWAILPGGFMLVLALVVGVSSWVTTTELLAALLFVGLGLVFFLLYLLDQKRRHWWALIPGSVLLVFGALALTTGRMQEASFVRWWPVALIVVGILVGLGARRVPAAQDKLVINSAPRLPAQHGAPAKAAVPQPARPALGDYSQPAPGAAIEILPDSDD